MPILNVNRVHRFYHTYTSKVEETDLKAAFRQHTPAFVEFLAGFPDDKREYRYAPGKWTPKDMLQHLIDSERVFCYRALCFARRDQQTLPGFDENEYAEVAGAAGRKWEDMVEEFTLLRKATEIMFDSFSEEQLEAEGSSGGGMNNYVLGLGFIILGHCRHHQRVLQERYLK